METIHIQRVSEGWVAILEGRGEVRESTLRALVASANAVIMKSVAPALGSSPGISWIHEDEFVRTAIAVGEDRARLADLEGRVQRDTKEQVVALAGRGLTVGDIGVLLGVSSARVSQMIKDVSILFHDSGDASDPIAPIKLDVDGVWVSGHVRGKAPNRIEYLGHSYGLTGWASGIGGQPVRQSYARIT